MTSAVLPVGWNPIDIAVHLTADQDWTISISPEEGEFPAGTTVVANIYPPGTQSLAFSDWDDPIDVWEATVESTNIKWHIESSRCDVIPAKAYVRWIISYPIEDSADRDDYVWAKGLVVRDD